MATKSNLDAGALEGVLDHIGQLLDASNKDISQKIRFSLLLLDKSLNCLAGLGLIARLAVEVQAQTEAGRRYVRKYSLGTRKGWNEEGEMAETPYIKQSELEEDE